MSKKEKPRYNLFQNSAYMLSAAWHNAPSVIWLCVITAVLAVATNLLGLFVVPTVLAAVEAAVPLRELITLILIFTGAMMLVAAANSYIRANTLFGKVDVRSAIIRRINDKLSQTSFPNIGNKDFRKKQTSAANATNANSKPTEAIWSTFADLLKNSAGLVIYLVLLASLTPWVIALVLATTVAGFFVNRYTGGWRYRNKDEEEEITDRLWYIVRRAKDKSLAKDIRLFGMGPWLSDVFTATFRLYRAFNGRASGVNLLGDIADAMLALARNGVAYIYLVGLVINGGLTAPEFLLFFTAIGGFTTWVSGVLGGVNTLHVQSLELSILRELLDYPEPFKFEDGKPLSPDTDNPYELRLNNVSFRYPEADENNLSNISLTIRPGEKLAIVGLNGAGKTTLIKLACGLLDPTSGEVLLNGQDIRQYNRRDYYKHFTAVFQEHSLLPCSIAENIAQELEPDTQKVKTAAEKAGLAEKIESLPKGYQTPLTKEVHEDGTELSGGETQRLLLARALYKNAPIIILDEPTAALDPIAESEIYGKYHQLTAGRTSIYISHRLASTRFCDRVILIEDGAITETGTHQELIAAKGRYAELYDIQSHYYKDEWEAHHG